jgi:hypothetical protein
MSEMLRCAHCGDVIGVYEPLVALVDGQALETSRTVEGFSSATAQTCFHRACFYELHNGEVEVDA